MSILNSVTLLDILHFSKQDSKQTNFEIPWGGKKKNTTLKLVSLLWIQGTRFDNKVQVYFSFLYTSFQTIIQIASFVSFGN